MSEGRRTRLYGSIDCLPTLADTAAVPAETGIAIGEYLDNYRIDDVLGRGGMGEVLSRRDDVIGRSVAIKRLRIEDPSPEIVGRFLREVRVQGRLEHPAVVPVRAARRQRAAVLRDEAARGHDVRRRVSRHRVRAARCSSRPGSCASSCRA